MTKSTLEYRKLIIKKSPIHGYGVFAGEAISVGDIIEECLLLPAARSFDESDNYKFADADGHYFLPLGNGAIYNHSDSANAKFHFNNSPLLTIIAKQDIKPDEEILINYGKKWFPSRRMKKKKIFSWKTFLQNKTYYLLALRFTLITSLVFILVALVKSQLA